MVAQRSSRTGENVVRIVVIRLPELVVQGNL